MTRSCSRPSFLRRSRSHRYRDALPLPRGFESILRHEARTAVFSIEPIRQHNPRYGTRGKLKAVILSCVEKAYPSEVTTPEIGLTLQVVFGLDFATWQETEEWIANSVRSQLRKLVKEGLVERLHEATAGAGVGRWRLVGKAASKG